MYIWNTAPCFNWSTLTIFPNHFGQAYLAPWYNDKMLYRAHSAVIPRRVTCLKAIAWEFTQCKLKILTTLCLNFISFPRVEGILQQLLCSFRKFCQCLRQSPQWRLILLLHEGRKKTLRNALILLKRQVSVSENYRFYSWYT